jgi:PAS domain S-box-containing protein
VKDNGVAQVREENELLRQEVRIAREAADITAQLVIKQFEETDKVMSRLEAANKHLHALQETALGVIGRLELTELLETIVTRAGVLVGATHGYIYLVEPDGTEMKLHVGIGAMADRVGQRIRRGDGLAGRVWETCKPLVVKDYSSWHGRRTQMEDLLLHGVMGVPLKSGPVVVGTIGLAYEDRERQFGENDITILSHFAALAAVAIDNARLFTQLQSQQQFSASLVHSNPVAIITADCHGRVLSWNPAAEQLFGYTQQEASGRILDEIVTTGALRQQAVGYTEQVRAGGSVRSVTQRCRRDGSPIDVEVLAVPVDGNDPHSSMIAIYHDLTELKQTEEALRQAKLAAEAATQAKSAFLATMSHEIRTPMNAVIGMTSLLLDTSLTTEQREFVETISSSGDALLSIINDILDFSKIEAGRIELEHRPLDLRACVEGAAEIVAAKAAEKGVELACLVEPDLPAAVNGDITRLRQILLNLLSNAVKFTDQGEVVLTVANAGPRPISAGEKSEWQLHFSVRDTGIGIPAERMSRLFKSFSQVDSSTTRRYGGTGLGLAISKRLVELMGGEMSVASDGVPGSGSSFHFTITAEEAELPPKPYLDAASIDLRGKRVLIVDDNATNRRIMSLQTSAWGMEPEATASPEEALSWLRHGQQYDLALLDRQMPDMDGLLLATKIAELRHTATLPELPPLVMVSSLGGGDMGAARALFAGILTKPIRASQLYDTLVTILGSGEQTVGLERKPDDRRFDADLARRNPLRILLAEDNPVNQKLALFLLQRLGYSADVVENGREAVASLRARQYDVVLMDMQMPEMDGLEATRLILDEFAEARQPRIIAMTANVMQEDRDACMAAGMRDFLAKPIRVDELVAALNRSRPVATETPASKDAPSPLAPKKQAPAAGDVSCLDPAAIAQLWQVVAGDAAFLAELVTAFLEDAPGLFEEMNQALAEEDAPRLRRAAHSLKANSTQFGAPRLASLCRELEKMGKADQLEQAKKKLAEAKAEYTTKESAFKALLQR